MKNGTKIKVILWLKKLFLASFLFGCGLMSSAFAIVLDWSGSYQVEANFLQDGGFEEFGRSQMFHNLHLQLDMKAFDNVRARSWLLFSPPLDGVKSPPISNSSALPSQPALESQMFLPQEGIPFGLEGLYPAFLSAKALFLEIAHDFGLFQLGWKPHHFGMGLYYNESLDLFSPVYNRRGSRGFISWKGFIGSSYYVSPLLHYLGENLFDLFIQGGWKKKPYGVELIYKINSLGVDTPSQTGLKAPAYFGLYTYYKTPALSVQLEGGYFAQVFGGALELSWQTPAHWLKLNLGSGLSSAYDKEAFYFDPSFSSKLSFLIEQYEKGRKKVPEYFNKYLSYSFHSAFYLNSSADVLFSDSLSLQTKLSTQVSYSDLSVLLYHAELTLKYHLKAGFFWNTSVGVLFPQDESSWQMGFLSQAAMTF